MLDVQDYASKAHKYRGTIFRYSGVSIWRIFWGIVRLLFSHLFGKRFVKASVNGHDMMLDLKTPGLSKVLLVYGTREILDTYLVKKEIKPGMTVLDIGANIGYYALLEASLEGTKKVYALEPDPRNITLLEKNVRLNGFGDRIQIYPYAVSDKNGTETFYLGERSNVSSFVKRGDVVGQAEVKCITLDDFEHIQEVDFIRMDVEGYEVPILRGARNFLTKTKKPIKIIMELHNKAYDKGNFNMNEQLEYLFQNDFYTRYIISAAAEKHEHIFSEKGYTPTQQAYENDTIRNLYKHITPGHSLSFLESGSIRAILLEKKVS